MSLTFDLYNIYMHHGKHRQCMMLIYILIKYSELKKNKQNNITCIYSLKFLSVCVTLNILYWTSLMD